MTILCEPLQRSRIPIAVKTVYTGYVVVLVPVYWRHYGPGNFLWFSDVALLLTVPALWMESAARLAGTQAVSIAVHEAAWNVDFAARPATGKSLIGLADYMFDPKLPRYLRALSLFHLWLPPLLIWTLRRLGYDRRSWAVQVSMT